MQLTKAWLERLKSDRKTSQLAGAEARAAHAVFESTVLHAFDSENVSPETHVVCFDCGRLYPAALKDQPCECRKPDDAKPE